MAFAAAVAGGPAYPLPVADAIVVNDSDLDALGRRVDELWEVIGTWRD